MVDFAENENHSQQTVPVMPVLARTTPDHAPNQRRASPGNRPGPHAPMPRRTGGADPSGAHVRGFARRCRADRETRSVLYATAIAAALLYLLLFGLR